MLTSSNPCLTLGRSSHVKTTEFRISSLAYKFNTGVFMYTHNSEVAVGSTPKFVFSFGLGKERYFPLKVLYLLQYLGNDNNWVTYTETRSLTDRFTEQEIVLTREDTRLLEETNSYKRRLVISVFYDDSGTTLHSTDTLEFTLKDLPNLVETLPEEDKSFDIVGHDDFLLEFENSNIIECDVEFSHPVTGYTASVYVQEPETGEPFLIKSQCILLAGNNRLAVLYQTDLVLDRIEIQAKSVFTDEEKSFVI